MVQTFLRIDDVSKSTGLPRSTIYYLAANGEFPKPVRIGKRLSAWREDEIVAWQKAKIDQRDEKK